MIQKLKIEWDTWHIIVLQLKFNLDSNLIFFLFFLFFYLWLLLYTSICPVHMHGTIKKLQLDTYMDSNYCLSLLFFYFFKIFFGYTHGFTLFFFFFFFCVYRVLDDLIILDSSSFVNSPRIKIKKKKKTTLTRVCGTKLDNNWNSIGFSLNFTYYALLVCNSCSCTIMMNCSCVVDVSSSY